MNDPFIANVKFTDRHSAFYGLPDEWEYFSTKGDHFTLSQV